MLCSGNPGDILGLEFCASRRSDKENNCHSHGTLHFSNHQLLALSLLTVRILNRPSLRPRLPRTVARKICDTRVNTTNTDLILLIRAVGRSDPKATTSDIMRLRLLRSRSDDEW